ncbi:MAG: Bug family tripartite tricarboxylate transporter substrate binding protein [Burkholderiaceae bacterium]
MSAALAVGSVFAAPAAAQEWPVPGRPIRILMPFPPGGTADTLSRAIAARLTVQLGVSVVVENRPGGSTIIAVNELKRSPPDGTTLMYTVTGTTSQLPHLYSKPPYDVFADFTPLCLAAYNQLILIAKTNAPFDSMQGLIDYARANPGKVNYASFGNGSFPHIVSEQLKRQYNIQMTHVPYKGGSDAGRAVMGGEVDLLFDAPVSAMNAARAGRVKMLAIVGPSKIESAPELKTMSELGFPGFDQPGLEQLLGPAGMPKPLVDKINAELVKALNSPEVKQMYVSNGLIFKATSAEEHARIIRESYDSWGEVIKRTGIKLD